MNVTQAILLFDTFCNDQQIINVSDLPDILKLVPGTKPLSAKTMSLNGFGHNIPSTNPIMTADCAEFMVLTMHNLLPDINNMNKINSTNLQSVFLSMDTDGDGFVKQQDLYVKMWMVEPMMTTNIFKAMFKGIKLIKKGYLNYEEFSHLFN